MRRRRELGELLVHAHSPLRVGLDDGDALEDLAQAAGVLVALVDLPQRIGRDEDRVGRGFGRREDTRERRLRALRVASTQLHLAELGAGLCLDAAVLHRREHASERLRCVGVALERRRERHVPRAQIVVGGVEREGLLERVERPRGVAEALAPQAAEAGEQRRALGAARAVELQRQVPRHFLGRAVGLERRRERGRGAPGETLDDDELLSDPPRVLVHGIEEQQLLEVRQRALRLLQAIGVEVDDAREQHASRGVVRRRIDRQRLLVQANDVAEPIRSDVERLEAPAGVFVARLEPQEGLQEFHHLVVGAARLREEDRGAPEQGHLLATRSVRSGARVHLGELLRLSCLREELVDLRERRRVARRQRERPFEVRHRADLVAEDVAEEAGGLEEELGGDRRLHRPEALSLRDALERERDLAQPVVSVSRLMQLLPRVRRQGGARKRREHRVDEGLFIVDLRLEREGGRDLARAPPRRLLLHGKPSVCCRTAALLPLG